MDPMLSKAWYAAYAASALTLAVGAFACSGAATRQPPARRPAPALERSQPSVVVYKRGGDKMIVQVGTAGGRLELANGARLDIPAGALSETVELTFSEGTHTTAFSNHDYERPVGPVVEIGPTLALNQPLKLSIPLSRLPEGFEAKDLALATEVVSDTQRAVQMHGVQTRWDYLPASSASGRAMAELNEVPGYRMQFVVSQGN
jgi:hypothetical protein